MQERQSTMMDAATAAFVSSVDMDYGAYGYSLAPRNSRSSNVSNQIIVACHRHHLYEVHAQLLKNSAQGKASIAAFDSFLPIFWNRYSYGYQTQGGNAWLEVNRA